MNVTIDINPSAGLRTLLDRARNLPAETLQAIGKALAASGPMIVGNAGNYRFTNQRGPFPVSENKLGFKSRQLRQSIYATPPQIQEGSNEVTMGFGSPIKYFGVHEFGGRFQIPGYFRRAVAVGSGSKLTKKDIARVKAAKKSGRGGAFVKPHTRYYAARAPMQTELRHARTEDIIMENARRAITRMLDQMEGGAA